MPIPSLCLDEALQQFAQGFRELLSKPQYQYFVTVLLGLMLCEGARTLRGLLRQIAARPSLAGLSRDLAEAPWEAKALAEQWLSHFRAAMQPQVAAEVQHQRQAQPKRRGRPQAPVVTGYLIGDDSTIEKRKGKKMEGVGLHHSTTEEKRVLGHSWVESLYVLLGRRCPLAPQLYRKPAVCTAEGVMPDSCELRQNKYLNNLVEQDHRFIKRLVKLGMGFFSFETAWRTLQGYEAINMLRKGQIRGIEKGDSMKQVACIASLFGVAA